MIVLDDFIGQTYISLRTGPVKRPTRRRSRRDVLNQLAQMTESPRSVASRILAILAACLAAIIGFFAFNLVDGVFGPAQAVLGVAACIAVTVFVVRRSPPPDEASDA
jgi:uncharacterized membrane protein YuzA (DUF378 family)